MSKIYETEVAGRPLSLEFGKVAGLANGSVIVRYGDTVVISCATASDKPRDGIDFFPLSIDYEEKMYAVGKIPGGFNRREGKPSDHAISDVACYRQTYASFVSKGFEKRCFYCFNSCFG